MESLFASLSSVDPILAGLARILAIVTAAVLLWFILSIPAAICYAALKTGFVRLASALFRASKYLSTKSHEIWITALGFRTTAVSKLTLRYVYDRNERDLLNRLQQVGKDAMLVSQQIQKASSSLDATLAPLKREVQLIVDGSHGAGETIAIPDIQDMQNSTLMRRTSIVMLFVLIPLTAALITVNTSLLTKFFESFFEEYISYQLGIKWATMVALMFSFLELALGVLMYYIGKASAKEAGMVGALLKTTIVVLVIALASIEGYLYLLLSIDIARQTKDAAIDLPAAIESFRYWWLSPFGFVIVVGLSLIGHFVVDGLNRFIEAGHLKDLKVALAEAKRSISRLDSVWDSIRTRVEAARQALVTFESALVSDTPSPLSVLSNLSEMNQKIGDTVQRLVHARREPISTISTAEAESVFDAHIFLSATFVVALIAFCWLQIHFFGLVQAFRATDWLIFLVVGILEAAALLAAGYKAFPNTTTLIEGIGSESLHSPREWLVTLTCIGVILSAILANLFLTRVDSLFQWGIFFAIALLAIAVLVLLGRTLPVLMFVSFTLLRQLAWIFAAIIGLLLLAVTWVTYTLVRALFYVLYLLAYPLLFVFWKSLLASADIEVAR